MAIIKKICIIIMLVYAVIISTRIIPEKISIVYANQGADFYQKGDLNNAVLLYEKSLRWNARAQVHKKRGDEEPASRDLESARQITVSWENIPAEPQTKVLSMPSSQAQMPFLEDTIVSLKNGQVMRGKLKKETDTNITLEVLAGNSTGVISFNKGKVEKIKKIYSEKKK